MEMKVTISLRVSIAEEWPNLNEICLAVRESIVKELPARVGIVIVEGMQEEIRDRLTRPVGRRAKKGLGSHERKGAGGVRCRFRTFRKQGFRSEPRRVKTDVGRLEFEVGYVECCGCGKKFAPILDVLGLRDRTGHSDSLEAVVSEVVSKTSYQRGEEEIEARGSAPVPKSSSHRWIAHRRIPESRPEGSVFAMADGTGFKKWPGERGDLRVVIGLNEGGKPRGLGVYAGESWEAIGEDIQEKLKASRVQLQLFTTDGEPGLDEHLASVAAEGSQRCLWHLPRDLNYVLWKDGVGLEERKQRSTDLAGLLGIEIPAGEYETVSEEDKEALRERVRTSEREALNLIAEFEQKGYAKGATYLQNAFDRLFEHVKLWLETGIIAPRTTSMLENMMRELGRRVKKLGWNWSDEGIVRIAKIILLRHYDREAWDRYWREALGLRDRCKIQILRVERQAV